MYYIFGVVGVSPKVLETEMSDPFDVIPFEVCLLILRRVNLHNPAQDIKDNWKKLGSGSFGNVYKGT